MISSARGRAIIEALPKGRVLTETDGPFTRVADRPTTPADVSFVVSHLAAIWRQQESEVVKQLQRNLRAAVPSANNNESIS